MNYGHKNSILKTTINVSVFAPLLSSFCTMKSLSRLSCLIELHALFLLVLEVLTFLIDVEGTLLIKILA